MWILISVTELVLAIAGMTTALVLNHRADIRAEERREAAAARAAAEEAERQKEAEAAAEAAAAEAAELAQAEALYDKCQVQLRPLQNVLRNVEARLNVGLSQNELSQMVGQASIAYSRIKVKALGQGNCLSAGATLESAFNAYNETVSTWNDCIDDYGCDVDRDILAGMQLKWARATSLISGAGKLMKRLDPHSSTYQPETNSL